VFKNETENIDPNGRSKNFSDENNVANKGCENKLFASSSEGRKQFFTASEKKAVSSLFPPTEHEVLSSGEKTSLQLLIRLELTPLRKDKMLTITKGQTGFT
jgi:hypothetical protein